MSRESESDPPPIPMRLVCPECRLLHVDDGEFATRPHHTHACQGCGMVWRPAIVATVGVRFLPGFRNTYAMSPPTMESSPVLQSSPTLPSLLNNTELQSAVSELHARLKQHQTTIPTQSGKIIDDCVDMLDRLVARVRQITLDDIEWIVNDMGELGVKVGDTLAFLYKGRSYLGGDKWRYVGKREFGECCHPRSLPENGSKERYTIGDGWQSLNEESKK